MANTRVFMAQGLNLLGQAIGGVSSIGVTGSYGDVIESSSDGAIGAEDVDRAGLSVDVAVECTDVAKINAVLDAAPGAATFSGRESGKATWQNRTIPGVVLLGGDLDLSKAADARLSLRGGVRFADGTKTLKDVIQVVGGSGAAPTQTYPARLYRPHGASFNPGVSIAPNHLESVRLSLAANVFRDYGDTDVGTTALDRGDWQTLKVTLTFKDAVQISGSDRCAELIDAGVGVLTVTMLGRGGAPDRTLTINNLQWSTFGEEKGREFWTFTVNGVCGWRSTSGTVYTLNAANKLFSIT